MAKRDLVHNRREALASTSRALARYRDGSGEALRGFGQALREAFASAERELSIRRAELRDALAALAAADDDDRATCQRRVETAEQKVRVAKSVVNTIHAASDQLDRRIERFNSITNDVTLRGQAELRALDEDLDRYLAAGGGASNSQAAATVIAGSSVSALGSALAKRGLEEIAVSSVDFSDNPVISWHKASRADVAWAIDRWEAVVSKVVARGGSRDELAARDARDGTFGTMRQLAGVWDMFLGTDAIALSEGASGDLEVLGGRHRLVIAAEMGVQSLPARVHRKGP